MLFQKQPQNKNSTFFLLDQILILYKIRDMENLDKEIKIMIEKFSKRNETIASIKNIHV